MTIHKRRSLGSSDRSRPPENPRGGEKKSSKTREEAWELFQRQPRLGATRRQEFEQEYKQKAQKVLTFRFFQCRRKVSVSVGGRSAQNRSGIRSNERSQREAEHGAGGFQLPQASSMEEDMGSASPRHIAVSCCKKLTDWTSSSLHWSPQSGQPFARVRFRRYTNVNSEGTSWRATVMTHFGLHDDVKMLFGHHAGQ